MVGFKDCGCGRGRYHFHVALKALNFRTVQALNEEEDSKEEGGEDEGGEETEDR